MLDSAKSARGSQAKIPSHDVQVQPSCGSQERSYASPLRSLQTSLSPLLSCLTAFHLHTQMGTSGLIRDWH